MSSREPSLEELRQDSERTRDALANSVTNLRDTVGDAATELKTLVSPAHIKQEIKSAIKEERASLMESFRTKARENPLQLAAVGAALAYPALGLLRAIPMPLMLIGAGLFLTSQRGQSSAKDAKAKLDEAFHKGAETTSDFVASVKSDLDDRVAGVRYAAEQVTGDVRSTADAFTDKARGAFNHAAETVRHAAGAASETVQRTSSSATDRVKASAASMDSEMKDRAVEAGVSSKNAVTEFVAENPLLVAGIGAAVGMFIAASIPSSEVENQLFGAGSEKLKGKAREAAATGFDKAQDLAAGAAGSIAASAAREGLDAAGIQTAFDKVADGVRAVADRGIDAALGKNTETEKSPAERDLP